MAKIVGIDPGLAATGIGIVTGSARNIGDFAYGSIRTSKDRDLASRLDRIYSGIVDVLRKEGPDLMVIEDVFSLRKHPKSGIMLGKVVGVILLAGKRSETPIAEISVREAKQVLTGNGNANKAQLERSVRDRLDASVAIRPDHASDALALALIGLYRFC
jgi:crossover junction endodeoxyribonuclease RuvC